MLIHPNIFDKLSDTQKPVSIEKYYTQYAHRNKRFDLIKYLPYYELTSCEFRLCLQGNGKNPMQYLDN
jgi:hypothetical protein